MKRELHDAAYALRRAQLMRKAKARGIEVPEGLRIDEIAALIQVDETKRAGRAQGGRAC